MGPKKDAPGKKTIQKQQEKIIEDKTFGLKNKNKSKAVQSYIKGVETQVKSTGKSKAGNLDDEFRERAEKKRQKEEEAFLASLSKGIKSVKQAEVEFEDEKRNVLCEFFKQGECPDGNDCKFSHDRNIEYNVSL
jgi:glutamyl-tRNA reductase